MPWVAYRHRYHMPSAVSRLRSQLAQNGSVVDAMMPKVVPSCNANRSAGADEPGSLTAAMAPYRLVKDVRTVVETSQVETVLDGDIDSFIEAYLLAAAGGALKKGGVVSDEDSP